MPAFYTKPETVMDLVDASVDRALDLLQLPAETCKRWDGGRTE
jgi:4-hydroxy-3-polyprenylbenzoate decarboxylase